jgi:phosphoribosylformylglycinamidine cyclo-ligase
MAGQREYARSGVDYDVLDRVKREAIGLAAATAPLLAASGATEVAASRGSSAYVVEVQGLTLAIVVEGLGTKSVLATDYLALTGISRFADIATDAVAAIINDVVSVGAVPLVITAYFSTGDAAWYSDERRSLELLRGWQAACLEAGAVWGGGESPALPGVVAPDALELAGSAIGLIPTGRSAVLGEDVAVGDRIVLLTSSGLHANGASLARRVVADQPEGLLTPLGEALLDPSKLYASFVRELLTTTVTPKFLNGVTGHGFLKIMRAPAEFHYLINQVPEVPEVLQFLVSALSLSPTEAYSTLNMGAGYVAIVAPQDLDETLRIAAATGHTALDAGEVVEGPRSLSIPSLGIEYASEELQLG